MYHKDFDRWNLRKKIIDSETDVHVFIKEREVWWTSIGLNIGSEIDGKNDLYERPVVILKKLNSTKFLAAPLTSKTKSGNYFVPTSYGKSGGVMILLDIRVLSSRRLLRKIGKISKSDWEKALVQLKNILQ